jgi:glyoxylase-like metal-dependent hydrolase (beta-lactamase superfamily II)
MLPHADPAALACHAQHPVALWRNVLRLTAPNPGLMTGPGTNSYLIGKAASGFIVIDPGPPDADHVQRLWQACADAQGRGGQADQAGCGRQHQHCCCHNLAHH